MTNLQTLHARLESAAYKVTDNFCYSCYKVVDGEFCPTCHSDDFMRHLEGAGVEYGTEWVITHLIEQHCTAVDGEDLFEEILDECYEEVKIGYSTFSPSQIVKELDPTAFRIGAQENLDSLAEDSQLYECNSDYYNTHEVEEMIDDIEAQ